MQKLPKVADLLISISDQIAQLKLHEPLYIGIHTGGAWIASLLHKQSDSLMPMGTLDISFYRDDFSQVGLNPQVKSSHLPVDIDNRHLILIDDVLHTGRTIRAALNELFSYGRPASVTLVTLIDRPGRELPIQADIVGHTAHLSNTEEIKLTQSDGTFRLEIANLASLSNGVDA